MSNALDRLEELEAERSNLVEEARKAILQEVEEGIKQLSRLGFGYTLVERNGTNGSHQSPTRSAEAGGNAASNGRRAASRGSGIKRSKPVGKRRTGIRKDVLDAIKTSGRTGVTRGNLITQFEANDDSYKQSISNALVALKRQGRVKAVKGVYRAA